MVVLRMLGFFAASMLLMISPAHSLCAPHNFTSKKVFANCDSLPHLNASLHWTYDNTNASLSVALVATPPNPNGWISYAVNLNGSGMLGAEALIAFRSNGSVTVKPYKLVSYAKISQEKLTIPVTGVGAEASGGAISLFATLELPATAAKSKTVNHVWQVGASVADGMPQKHPMSPENLKSKGTLELTQGVASQNGNSTTGKGTSGGGERLGVSFGVLGLLIGSFVGLCY